MRILRIIISILPLCVALQLNAMQQSPLDALVDQFLALKDANHVREFISKNKLKIEDEVKDDVRFQAPDELQKGVTEWDHATAGQSEYSRDFKPLFAFLKLHRFESKGRDLTRIFGMLVLQRVIDELHLTYVGVPQKYVIRYEQDGKSIYAVIAQEITSSGKKLTVDQVKDLAVAICRSGYTDVFNQEAERREGFNFIVSPDQKVYVIDTELASFRDRWYWFDQDHGIQNRQLTRAQMALTALSELYQLPFLSRQAEIAMEAGEVRALCM